MIRIDLYAHGAGLRARLHHHEAEANEPCTDECEEYAQGRAYPQRGVSPAEYRQEALAAVVRSLMEPAVSHRHFASMLDETRLMF